MRHFVLLLAIATSLVTGCGDESDVRQIDTYEVSVSADGTSISVTAEPCGELRVSTVETAEEVRLTVMLIGGGDSCIGASSPPVTLVRPLAGRTIVDDRSGDILSEF